MNENLERQMLGKLKKQTCEQQNCLSENKDNVQLVIFGNPQVKKNGLMCSECFVDSSLLKQVSPVQKYVLPVRKYLHILINYHKEYVQLKQSLSWGPNIVNKQAEGIKRKVQAFYNDEWKFILEITQYVDSLTKKATDDLKRIYQDADFDKMVEYFNEENQAQQQRMNLTNQLSHICKNIKLTEGKHLYATQTKIKKEADQVVRNYRHNLERVILTLKDLNEVQKDCLKNILV